MGMKEKLPQKNFMPTYQKQRMMISISLHVAIHLPNVHNDASGTDKTRSGAHRGIKLMGILESHKTEIPPLKCKMQLLRKIQRMESQSARGSENVGACKELKLFMQE